MCALVPILFIQMSLSLFVGSSIYKSSIMTNELRRGLFSEEEVVYLRNTTGGGNKWVPGVIVKQTGPMSYKVQGRDADVTFRRHGDHLRPRFVEDELVKETDCSEMDTSVQHCAPEEEKQAVSEFPQKDCGGVTGVTQSPRHSSRIRKPPKHLDL
ncbi:uncharacterized protein K02A2.6 [Tachysurus ichikawai]